MKTSRNFSMIEYFNRKADAIKPAFRFSGKSQEDFLSWKQCLLAELRSLLGPMPTRVPLNAEVVWEIEEEGLIKQRVVIDTESDMSVAALVFMPKSAKQKPCPAILCNHGHGEYAKDSVMGVRSKYFVDRNTEIAGFNYDYGLQMAKHGYVTMAIDYRGFGERSDGGNPYPGRDKCNVHYIRGSLMGINLLTLDIWDAMRCIDYLCELGCVENNKVGTMGLSFGGTMTTWITLMDERIRAADIICYSCRFKNFAIENGNICGSQYLPGLFALCDVPDLHGLIAPKPLLVEIGVHDKCFHEAEALSCSTEVRKIFEVAGVLDNYEVDLFGGDHRFSGNKAFDFFDKYLKG
ncbi:MAG: hypothetical protein A2Y12_05465 [Planctomycetes bacterium GWF2_42_9]|nr:MAG: hypothetical protein A2Y12_05465 [Planctomycetes bacterium GWF2_42_9]